MTEIINFKNAQEIKRQELINEIIETIYNPDQNILNELRIFARDLINKHKIIAHPFSIEFHADLSEEDLMNVRNEIQDRFDEYNIPMMKERNRLLIDLIGKHEEILELRRNLKGKKQHQS